MTKKTPRTLPKTQNSFPEPLEHYINQLAIQAAGKPLSESLLPGTDLTRLLGRFVELAYQQEMTQHLGYEPHARASPEQPRHNARNGSSKKTLKTTHGEVDIQVPRDRQASFEPRIVPKHKSLSGELERRIISMYSHGMSTRDIQEHLGQLYSLETDTDLVSRLLDKIEPELIAWRNRPLEPVYPVVFVDAIHQNVRHAHGVHPTAIYVVSAYDESGRYSLLGVHMAPEGTTSESASFWHQVLITLQKRGLQDILILAADGLTGLEEAVGAVYPTTRFQPCVVHMVRASLKTVSYRARRDVAQDLRRMYQAPSYEAAQQTLEELEQSWEGKHPLVVKKWRINLPRLQNLWSYGEGLRKMVYTTNALENTNRQLRKQLKTRSSMPNVTSALRLVTLVAQDVNKKSLSKRARRDWSQIVAELHIHFGERLPTDWGYRHMII